MGKNLESSFIKELKENSNLRKSLFNSNQKVFGKVSKLIMDSYFKENAVEEIEIENLQKQLNKNYSCNMPQYLLRETLENMSNAHKIDKWGKFKIYLDKNSAEKKITKLYSKLKKSAVSYLQDILNYTFSLDLVNDPVSCSFQPYKIKILFWRPRRDPYGGELFSYDTENERAKDYGTLTTIKNIRDSLK